MGRRAARTVEERRFFEVTKLLLQDGPISTVLEAIVKAVIAIRGVESVAVLLPDGGHLRVLASAGRPFSTAELDMVERPTQRPIPVGMRGTASDQLRVLSLSAASKPVGLVVVRGLPCSQIEREELGAFADHAAIALERAQLRSEMLRSETLKRTDELRRALLATVAHDLIGPLSTMKIATSSLCAIPESLPPNSRRELCGVLGSQIDYLIHLVNGLLGLARSEAGVLAVRREVQLVETLLHEAVSRSSAASDERRVIFDVPDHELAIDADPLLIHQVIVNLVDNANRYGPPGTQITVGAHERAQRVEVSVADQGPGVPAEQRDALFDPFVRNGSGGRAGLGLAIAKAFVEAHHQQIWAEDADPSGACFVFTLDRSVNRAPSMSASRAP